MHRVYVIYTAAIRAKKYVQMNTENARAQKVPGNEEAQVARVEVNERENGASEKTGKDREKAAPPELLVVVKVLVGRQMRQGETRGWTYLVSASIKAQERCI